MGYKSRKEWALRIGDFSVYVGRKEDGFEGVHGGNGSGSRIWKVECCWNSAIKRSFV